MARKQSRKGRPTTPATSGSPHFRRNVELPGHLTGSTPMQLRRTGGFGWKPDLPDARDQLFSVAGHLLQALPSRVDLRSADTSIYDQGHIGSCTANAIARAIQFDRRKLGLAPDFVPSRLFIYFNERSIEGSIANDSGAQIRDGIKSVNKLGAPPESDWSYDDTPAPYDGGPFPGGSKPAQRPTQKAYKDALQYKVTSYQRLTGSLAQLKGALAGGFPFVFGFTVYENLYDSTGRPQTGIPLPGDSAAIGGHAVMAIGYEDEAQRFIIRNSWGTVLGNHGYFYLPYAYVSSYASDFWVIRGTSH